MHGPFRNRAEAGQMLAEKLAAYAHRPDVVVLALPRGGVPVAYEVAQTLDVPLDVFSVRKLGMPGYEELAIGAIAPGGVRVINERLVKGFGISETEIELVASREQRELQRRERLYRGSLPSLEVRGRTIILVDDGLATGATMRAAVAALKQKQPAQIVVAAPVASQSVCDEFEDVLGTPCVCALLPHPLGGVGQWYVDFTQTTDEEVRELLERSARAGNRCVA